jgi:hypothetical protein
VSAVSAGREARDSFPRNDAHPLTGVMSIAKYIRSVVSLIGLLQATRRNP